MSIIINIFHYDQWTWSVILYCETPPSPVLVMNCDKSGVDQHQMT